VPAKEGDTLKAFFKKWPKFYELLLFLTSTIFFYGLSAEKALKKTFPGKNLEEKLIINLGSGTNSFDKNVINLDICDFANVDIIADAANLPFADQSVDMIISESLLEHVPKPEKVIEEIKRVLKDNGYVYIEMPFVFPFHASPNDYTRFTLEGLKKRFSDFKIIKAGTRSGPAAALLIQSIYTITLFLSFGSKKLYSFWVNFFMVILSPFKILDLPFALFPQSHQSASVIYLFVQKL
jgi:SAM-dependent methyltransferase